MGLPAFVNLSPPGIGFRACQRGYEGSTPGDKTYYKKLKEPNTRSKGNFNDVWQSAT